MRRLTVLSLLAVVAPALADDPPAMPATIRLHTTLPRLAAPSCTGRLATSTDPCEVAFQLSTSAALIGLDMLLPIERRLTPFAPLGAPIGGRRDAPPGLWVTGFSSDPEFVGIGSFDMRDRR